MRSMDLRLFVLLTFVLGFLGPACNFLWGGQYSVVEICTTFGIEKRVVQNDEQPDEPSSAKKECPFCFQSANMAFGDVTSPSGWLPVSSSHDFELPPVSDFETKSAYLLPQPRGPPALI